MKNKEKAIGNQGAWETGALGQDAKHAIAAPAALSQQVDDALGLQMISIRLPKELIEDFKTIAQFHGLGYQPLMRDALKRFAEGEFKKIAIQAANEKAAREKQKTKAQQSAASGGTGDAKQREDKLAA